MTPKVLSQMRGRWKTSDKWHPAVLPNISGQEHRTAQAVAHHSGVEAEKPLFFQPNKTISFDYCASMASVIRPGRKCHRVFHSH